MTSLKTKNIWFLAAFLFLSIVPALARVVAQGMWPTQGCNQFLLQGIPPTIPNVPQNIWENNQDQNPYRYRIICQAYEKNPRFLTLYDTENKIPVFSAYRYIVKSQSGRPPKNWMIEPQLEDNADPEDIYMKKQDLTQTYNNQAVDNDYRTNTEGTPDRPETETETRTKYTRGHLFPSVHAFDKNDKISTFTLTNIVPQSENFNQKWINVEKCTQCLMEWYISNKQMQCFVVVGARPGNNYLNNIPNNDLDNIPNNDLNRVNIPSMFWSAFYCNNNNYAVAGAHWGDHDNLNQNLFLRNLPDLNAEFNRQYNVENSNVFPDGTPDPIPDKTIRACPTICVKLIVQTAQPEASS